MSSGRIPEQVVDAVLKHHDIVDVVGKYVHLAKQGHYMKGLCPFHSEKTPSFTVTPEKQIYYCYGCQASGNAIGFIMDIEGLTFPEAVRHLAEEADIPVGAEEPSAEKSKDQAERASLYDAYETSAKWYHHVLLNTGQGKPALEYLRSRGLSDKWIEQFRIGFAPPMWDTLARFLEKRNYSLPLMEKGGLLSAKSDGSGYVDKFRDRVIFPLHDPKGRIIAFAGRTMGDAQPKYLNSPETVLFNKSRSLFNFHQARAAIRKTRTTVLFEGYMDTIKAWEAGVHNGVATMGTALTEDHALMLRRNCEKVIVCYDGDSAGRSAASKSIPILEKAGMEARIAVLPKGLDPDEFLTEYGAGRFRQEILEGAVTSVKFKLIYARGNFQLQEEAERLRYVKTAVKLIGEVGSAIEREHYAKELAAEFSELSLETVKQEVNEYRQDFLKKRDQRDKNDDSWNNVRNNERGRQKLPGLKPAYYTAEQKLLTVMLHDREVADYVQERLGDGFNHDTHAALAAYLYAYYAQGNEPDVSRYLAKLQDERLEKAAGALLMMDSDQGANAQVIDDYIREIRKYPGLQAVKEKKEEMVRMERAGEIAKAAQIASEIITLERQLKSL